MGYHAHRRETSWTAKPYPEIEAIAELSGSVAVVPFGSTEQHGHHLPTGTDTFLAETIAHAGAEHVIDEVPVIVMPAIWTGYSPHHMVFGGTVTLPHETLLGHVQNVADSILESGFDAVLLLNGHGGNIPLVGSAVGALGPRSSARILGVTYYQLAQPIVEDLRDTDIGGMAHGGEFETSLMLHCHPDLVDEDAMEGTYFEDPFDRRGQDLFDDGPLSVYRSFDEYTQSGAIGDPKQADAEKGAALYEFLREELARLLREIHEQTRE